MRDTGRLLADARRLFDADNGLADAVGWRTAAGGFADGANWMRRAMATVRGTAPSSGDEFTRLGLRKYGLAMLAGATAIAVGLTMTPFVATLPLAVLAFYAVEVRMVFAFPLALDGDAAPLRHSHRLLTQTMPSTRATRRVLRIAATMLLGGLIGRGFVRSWCVGCLAVVLWYEDARRAAVTA